MKFKLWRFYKTIKIVSYIIYITKMVLFIHGAQKSLVSQWFSQMAYKVVPCKQNTIFIHLEVYQ